jgi:hypothetical protein
VVDDNEQGHVPFSVVELDGGSLIGAAALWGIDNHHRSAPIGLGLPAARGKGYGADVVAVLCHYGFVVRGLRRMPRWASSSTAAAVNCLLTDAIWKRVCRMHPAPATSAITASPFMMSTLPWISG